MTSRTRTRNGSRQHRTAEAQRLLDLLNALGSTTFRQLLWQKASEIDLTYAQSQVLFHVAEHPDCHMGEVAKAFGVTLPAVTHIVDRLAQKDLLTRADHPTDRRVYVLDLTRGGRALGDELQAIPPSAVEDVRGRMSVGASRGATCSSRSIRCRSRRRCVRPRPRWPRTTPISSRPRPRSSATRPSSTMRACRRRATASCSGAS